MKNEDIKQFVKSVAEIKELKPATDGSRPPEEMTPVLYQGEWIEIDRDNNPTLGFKFIKLKDRYSECRLGCGEIVKNQIIEKRLALTPERHWRTHCRQCQAFVHPDGSTLIKGAHKIQAIYMAYFNEKNK